MSIARNETELRVLLVDADEDDFRVTRDIFSEFSGCRFRLDWVTDFDEAVDTISRKVHDLYLIDDRLSKSNGLELIRVADAQACTAPILLLIGRGERIAEVTEAEEDGVEFLDKGILDASLLGRAIRYTCRQKRSSELLEREVAERTAEIILTNRILHDEIAERKRAEMALREADRRKDEFLATLAHELRNPLAPICNALEILRIAGDRPEIRESHRAMIDRQVRQMIRLIDDLLDISRISQGTISLRSELIELGPVISGAVESIRPMIDRAGHSLSVKFPDTPIELHADPTRLTQVLLNLLNNAARYTEPGGQISLDAFREHASVCIHVKDNGIGIPAEQLPYIFETFGHIKPSSEQSRAGLGIGLSLVRSLVQLHDGSIEVISKGAGRGSEFIVRLPIEQPESESAPA